MTGKIRSRKKLFLSEKTIGIPLSCRNIFKNCLQWRKVQKIQN